MSIFKVDLDISSLTQYLDTFAKELTKDVSKAVKGLADSTHSNIIKETGKKLDKWDRKKYLENLSPPQQEGNFAWVIVLNEPAVPIEEGREPWDMKGQPGKWGLLKNPEFSEKTGKYYKIIPMTQGKVSNTMNMQNLSNQEEAVDDIKSFLKDRNKGKPRDQKLHFNKLEVDPRTGSPRVSKNNPKTGRPMPLHSFDVPSRIPGAGNTEQLARLNIYQVQNAKTGKINKVMTTFRTAVEGDNKWMHKSIGAKNLFDDAQKWAENEWNNSVLPALMAKYQGK